MGLNIVIEANIPFIRGIFEPYASVSYLPPEAITSEVMSRADALVTRTRTRVGSSLLSSSPCSMVASATIGLDHVDLPWCESRGIEVANAPGCNAPAVAQYVLSSILHLHPSSLEGLTIGVVGVGHVGSIVARWAAMLGMKVLQCDPPRAEREGGASFTSLDHIAREADFITFHTPLTSSGPYPTFHLCSTRFLSSLGRRPVIINSARGAVVDTQALCQAITGGSVSASVIDCWEGEPAISLRLLELARIATPHIAGYSREGKIRASRMAAEAVCRHFGLPLPRWPEFIPQGAASVVTPDSIISSYDPFVDTRRLKSVAADFESLRNQYTLRHEVV